MGMPDLEQIRKNLPAHYNDCWSDNSTDLCDCTATADVEALLALVEQQDDLLDDVDNTLAAIAGPDDDGT